MLYRKLTLFCFLLLLTFGANAVPISDSVIVMNAGVDGNNTTNLLSRVNKDVIKKRPDVVVMMIGTNDMFNVSKHLTIKKFERNYQRLINIIKKYADLILMTIPPVYAPYIIARKPQFKFGPNGPHLKVELANRVIKHLAEKNHCTLIDLHNILKACGSATAKKNSLFQNEINFGIKDGVHPTYNGTRVIAAAVYQTIEISEPDAKKIVCFGDSITNGFRLKGAGTTTGQTYPAVLNKMFNP